MADDAGALLVRSGLVSSSALDAARARVVELGGTLGEQLVAAEVLTDEQLTDFYKQRLLVPQVNPNILARLPAKVVAVIPSDMAIELRAIPVSLDGDNNLTIAMSDPSDRHAVDEIAFFTGAYVVRAVATQMQIAWCLAHYYGHVTHLGQRLLQDGSAQPSTRTRADTNRPRPRGLTGKVEASRHRGLVPGQASVTASGEVIEATPRDTITDAIEQLVASADEPTPVDTKIDAPTPRARSVSGEIRAPIKRAPSIRPPLPEDDSGEILLMDVDSGPVLAPSPAPAPQSVFDIDSGPVMTIEADEAGAHDPVFEISRPSGDELTNPALPSPKRRKPADPDPPELAARAGEVQLATGEPIKKISFDEPRIIISDEINEPPPPPVRPAHLPVEAAIEVSGELRTRDTGERGLPEVLSSIFVELGEEDGDENDDVPAVIHDPRVDESAPVLLDRRRPSDPPTDVNHQAAPAAEIDDEPSDVVVLHSKKPSPASAPIGKQRSRVTQVGIGPVTAATRAKLIEDGIPAEALDDIPTASRAAIDNDPTRIDTYAAPARDDDTSDVHVAAPPSPYADDDDTSRHVVPTPSKAVPPPSGHVRLDAVKPAARRPDDDDDDDDAGGKRSKPTRVMSTVELDRAVPGRQAEVHERLDKSHDYDGVDEGWGPPGTTIPPPLLGAIPGSDHRRSGMIPMPDMDSAPLMVAPPSPPERGPRPHTITEAGLNRALEAATSRVLELVHTLDHTENRDQVVAVMIAHLAETHQRAGFFAARAGELTLFAITPRVPVMPAASLRLDRPSTLQDVVGTRLPYRGPMHDDTSRQFLTATLGACPPEILLVPVAVRERVVGVLFGDHRMKHTFDDQLALGSRAAGMALERILKNR